MTDIADTASDYQSRLNAEAEAKRIRYEGESAADCVECGEPINAGRRKAIPGVQTCIDCAILEEHRR